MICKFCYKETDESTEMLLRKVNPDNGQIHEAYFHIDCWQDHQYDCDVIVQHPDNVAKN